MFILFLEGYLEQEEISSREKRDLSTQFSKPTMKSPRNLE
jgi:hypothetical protein